jgi:isopenicillin N synthase-like dioxygenase
MLKFRETRMADAIPVIDLTAFTAQQPGALEVVAREIHDALTQVGFFVITGHGVPAELIDRVFDDAKRLHDLPMSAKLGLKLNEHNNGYMAMARYAVWTSDVNKNDKPDLNEAFFIKRERAPDHPMRRANRRFAGANVWPDEGMLPGFRTNILEYAAALEEFTTRLLPAVGLALDLPLATFPRHFADGQSNLRLSHYPPVPAEANQFGIAPHSDANFMTFLPQSEVPGLQVRMPDGNWLDVPFIPGSFAVNSGDTLRRWSNGRFLSTPHRALPPVGRHRYAVPYFMAPHLDTVIECLPTCTGPGNPPRWEPITYEAWITAWTNANYDPKRQQDVAA